MANCWAVKEPLLMEEVEGGEDGGVVGIEEGGI